MLKDRGIKRGVEVFVKNREKPNLPMKKARVINTYPHPSNWLVVQYDNGNTEEVYEFHVTTMFEVNRGKLGPL